MAISKEKKQEIFEQIREFNAEEKRGVSNEEAYYYVVKSDAEKCSLFIEFIVK